jgi:predicted Zn-dependent peptidase
MDALRPLVDALPKGSELPPRPAPAPWAPRLHRTRAGHEASIVVLAARTPPLHHPTIPALRLASAALGAQSGPLFMNLRETASLAYSVWARDWEGFDGGLFALGLSTDPARADEARDALLNELDRVATHGLPADELARHKAMLKGQLAMSHQRAAGRALHLGLAGLYGRPMGLDALSAEIDAIDGAALQAAVASLPDPLSVVVRPLERGGAS